MNKLMNKGVLIGLILVLALAGFFLIRGRNINPGTSLDGAYSIKDMVALNKNLECNFDKSDENTSVKGKIFISEGRVKGEFNINSKVKIALTNIQEFKTYFLMRDGASYTWTSLAKAGFKSQVVENATSTNNNVINPDDKNEYKCSPWEEAVGTFDVPQDIIFSTTP